MERWRTAWVEVHRGLRGTAIDPGAADAVARDVWRPFVKLPNSGVAAARGPQIPQLQDGPAKTPELLDHPTASNATATLWDLMADMEDPWAVAWRQVDCPAFLRDIMPRRWRPAAISGEHKKRRHGDRALARPAAISRHSSSTSSQPALVFGLTGRNGDWRASATGERSPGAALEAACSCSRHPCRAAERERADVPAARGRLGQCFCRNSPARPRGSAPTPEDGFVIEDYQQPASRTSAETGGTGRRCWRRCSSRCWSRRTCGARAGRSCAPPLAASAGGAGGVRVRVFGPHAADAGAVDGACGLRRPPGPPRRLVILPGRSFGLIIISAAVFGSFSVCLAGFGSYVNTKI